MKIGVFDSGVGGLTVLRALLERIPSADYLYLGDTARLPYGAKSRATVARYAASSARFLVAQGAEFLVIACNTASALALDVIREAAPVPVLGVVETGANAAQTSSATRDVLVIATAATVESHAYLLACEQRNLRALEKACPLLVPLVEEGWIEHPVTQEVLRVYMSELMTQAVDSALNPDTLVLGCTHYPLLRPQIERAVPARWRVIDSAAVTAEQVAGMLEASGGSGSTQFYATDSVTKFRALGSRFLGRPIDGVELVDLGG
ncbi:MAG TPA: glutamate racemase [Acidobacteriaceae bacterium]|nr:glutamate racemase [Acidobacteriaceae bacterium]